MLDENQIWVDSVERTVDTLREYAASVEEAFDLTRGTLWNVKNGYYSLDYDTSELLSYIRRVRRESISLMDAFKDSLIAASPDDRKKGNYRMYPSLIKDIEGIITSLDHLALSATPYRAYELTFDEIDAIASEGQTLAEMIRSSASRMLQYTHATIRKNERDAKSRKWFWIVGIALFFVVAWIGGECGCW